MQLPASVPGRLHNRDLVLVHQADDAVGVGRFGDLAADSLGTPAVDGDHLAFRMASGQRDRQRLGKAESVAVIGAHHASVGGSLLSDNEIRTSERRHCGT